MFRARLDWPAPRTRHGFTGITSSAAAVFRIVRSSEYAWARCVGPGRGGVRSPAFHSRTAAGVIAVTAMSPSAG